MINCVVPKDSTYGSKIDWSDPCTLSQFKKVTQTHMVEEVLQGKSQTEMECLLGGGDMQRGADNLKVGLARSDILEREGLFFFKQKTITRADELTSGKVLQSMSELPHGNDVVLQLRGETWASFALFDQGAPSTRAICDEKPPSSEAQAHLKSAYESMQVVIHNIRTKSIEVRGTDGCGSSVAKQALERAMAAERGELADVLQIMLNPEMMSDSEVKNKLVATSKTFGELVNLEKELVALLRVSKKTT